MGYALGRLGDTSISPMTRPMTGVPPNTLKADQHIRGRKKGKGSLCEHVHQGHHIVRYDGCGQAQKAQHIVIEHTALRSPRNRPVAAITGMIG